MKKKVNLNDLKVRSFVVGMNEDKIQTVKGGASGFGIDCGAATASRFECDQHAI